MEYGEMMNRARSCSWLAVLAAFAVACGGEAVLVGNADPGAGAGKAAPGALCAPLVGALPVSPTAPSFDPGPVAASRDSLLYFRTEKGEAPATSRPKLVRYLLPDGPERIVDEGARPGAMVASAASAFWIDNGALLREVDLAGATGRVIDREGALSPTEASLAATPEGDLAFIRYPVDGGERLSTLWRRRAGKEPEAVAILEGVIEQIRLTPSATLLVSRAESSQEQPRLYVLGPLASLPARPEIARLEGPREAALGLRAPAVEAFDGTRVYYSELASKGPPGAHASWRIMAMTLATGELQTLAQSTPKEGASDARMPRSLVIRGNELVWIEAEAGTCFCNLEDGSYNHSPQGWVKQQSIRAVATSGGEVRTLWSDEPRVAKAAGLDKLVPLGCELAVIDGSPRLAMVLR